MPSILKRWDSVKEQWVPVNNPYPPIVAADTPPPAAAKSLWIDTGSGDEFNPVPLTTQHADLQGLAVGDPHTQYAKKVSVAVLEPTTGAVAVDMDADDIYTHALTGDPTYSTSNRVNGSSVLVRVDANGVDRTPSFPAGWAWLTGVPATFTTGKTGLLSLLVAGGTAESDVVASFVEES